LRESPRVLGPKKFMVFALWPLSINRSLEMDCSAGVQQYQ